MGWRVRANPSGPRGSPCCTHPTTAVDGVPAQEEGEGLAGIAGLHPGRESREAAEKLHKHGLTADVVESDREVQQEGPATLIRQ